MVEKNWVLNRKNLFLDFFDCPDVSKQTSGRKDAPYIRKVNGERLYKQKRYLQRTIRELLEIVNRSSNFNEAFEDSFP